MSDQLKHGKAARGLGSDWVDRSLWQSLTRVAVDGAVAHKIGGGIGHLPQGLQVNAEDVQDFCKKNEVSSVPVVLFFKDGEAVARVRGANAAELTKTVLSLRDKNDVQQTLNVRLKALINKAPIMLFMKGTPEEARCGFSRKMLEVLREHNVKFDSFNVLSDEAVREGLKVYSDWPTYPQLYAHGELIGGVDIVTQLAESNELLSALGLQ